MSRIKNKDPRSIRVREFQCTICGVIVPATKRAAKTLPGHIKHMYCYSCNEVTEHVQCGLMKDGEKVKVTLKLLVSSPKKVPQALRYLERIGSDFGENFELDAEIAQIVPDGTTYTGRGNFVPVYCDEDYQVQNK